MEYMVVWLHDFTDTYYSVHGFDQIDDAEAFYQKLATNNPNIFSCLGKVEIVEQQFTSSAIFDGLPRPSKDRASGTEEDDSVEFKVKRLGKLCAWRCGCSVVVPFIESESSSTLRMPSPFFAVSAKLRFTAPRIATCSCAWLSSQFSN